ncbi:hypothetical protein DAPPUDRAFT_115797 [Daphnia pulex]|uniref:Uncharacterized protein n=1 Tax=Daphnia pulex TaxID=6669 RepID=E9HMK2_DAPPU|nr:hypothetical protein DAPPUDRAFT_115797 [Daphnia pulex]|eukprot:EFX67036.1 hypothetical protein DAPPUDRAFT_115797 [Daphnia pulex]
MAVIGETRKSKKRFSSTVGIGSRQQDLFGEEEISSRTSSVVSWRKSARRVDGSATGEGKQVVVLTSLVAVKFKMDGESAFQPGPLCATLRSFCLPCCFRDPWGGWAENDVFRDDWCVFVDEGTKTIVVLGDEAVKGVGWIGDEKGKVTRERDGASWRQRWGELVAEMRRVVGKDGASWRKIQMVAASSGMRWSIAEVTSSSRR